MKRLLHATGLLISALAIIAFVAYAFRMADQLDLSLLSSPAALLGLCIAGVVSATIIPLSAFAWKQLLRSAGSDQAWGQLAVVMGITQFGKYLPGNVAQHLGRLAMSVQLGVPASTAGISLLAELLLAVIAAAVVGAFACGAYLLRFLGQRFPALEWAWGEAGLCVLAVSLAALVIFSPALLKHLARQRFGASVAVPGSRALLLAFCCYLANYLVLGTGIAAMSSLLLGDAAPPPLLLTGAFAVSWIIGFFMPGAPAGLGVREGAILTLLQASGAGADMLLLVIGLRVATTAGDLICFTVASAFRFAARKGRSLPHT